MPDHLGGDYWRKRAEDARRTAAAFKDKHAQRVMLDISKNYEELAAQADAIEKGKAAPS